MKQITITLLLACMFPTVQASPIASPNDTLFIFRKVTDAYYHAIYIEKDRESKTYQRAIDFSINERHKELYDRYKSRVEEEAPGCFSKHETYDLPRNWLPLYKYKDKYYLYDPSNGRCNRKIINNREYISWGMEGPFPFPLRSVEKRSDTGYIVSWLNPFEHGPSIAPRKTIIHIIDPETKMAVFEWVNQDGVRGYRLCIPAASASNFDLIVNYCDNQRQLEFQFDKIDYAKLLDNGGSK